MGYETPALTNAQRAELFERLIGFRKDIQNAREAGMHTEADESDDLVARIALAVLAAEPVAVKYASGEVLTKEECADDERVFAVCCRVETPLFTAPPVLALRVPDGWKLVPKNATGQMVSAWREAIHNNASIEGAFLKMVDAAPELVEGKE